jgi:hypothetical protein
MKRCRACPDECRFVACPPSILRAVENNKDSSNKNADDNKSNKSSSSSSSQFELTAPMTAVSSTSSTERALLPAHVWCPCGAA